MTSRQPIRAYEYREGRLDPRPRDAPEQKLIESCQGLVRSLAWKIHRKLPPHVDLEDLVSFGQLGLAEAARDFDEARGGKFSTYAYYRVRGAIFDGLSKMAWFSRHHYHASRYEHMANELLEVKGREDTDLGSVESGGRWVKDVSSSMAVVYLMTTGEDEGGSGSLDLEDESSPSPQAVAIESEMRSTLHELIDALPSDAGRLIRMFYFEGKTLQDAGKELGISKAWASRLHARSLERLAHSLRLLGAADG